jgi:hypothetical protein
VEEPDTGQLRRHLTLDYIKDERGMRRIAGHTDHLGPRRGELSDACDDTTAGIGRIGDRIGGDLAVTHSEDVGGPVVDEPRTVDQEHIEVFLIVLCLSVVEDLLREVKSCVGSYPTDNANSLHLAWHSHIRFQVAGGDWTINRRQRAASTCEGPSPGRYLSTVLKCCSANFQSRSKYAARPFS